MAFFSFALKYFYILGSLVVCIGVNIIFLLILFFSSVPKLFIRGTSPWMIYLPFIIATLLALGYSFLLDRRKIFSDRKILPVFYGVYTIYSVGSISLCIITQILLLLGMSGVYTPFSSLFLLLLLGIPLCLFLAWIYLAIARFILMKFSTTLQVNFDSH